MSIRTRIRPAARSEKLAEALRRLKTFFPVPVSDPIMDGYFVHTVSNFLDRVDNLKSEAPLLGQREPVDYRECERARFPEAMSSVERTTEMLVHYCRGLEIWAHPNSQMNVVPPTTIPSIVAFIASAIYNPNLI